MARELLFYVDAQTDLRAGHLSNVVNDRVILIDRDSGATVIKPRTNVWTIAELVEDDLIGYLDNF